MKASDIRWLYERLQRELGQEHFGNTLKELGWTFGFTNRKTQVGTCWGGAKKHIGYSRHFMRAPDELIEDVLRHEIAHACDYITRGTSDHGPKWKRWAVKCGADPTRTCEVPPEARPAAKYTLTCPNCSQKVRRHRLTKRSQMMACAKCCDRYNRGKFDAAYRFRITQNF